MPYTGHSVARTRATLISSIRDGRRQEWPMASAIDSDPRPKREVIDAERDSSEDTGGDRKAEAAAKAQAERDKLLKAAMEVLQRSGWWGFKVESVLRQAGLSTRSF